MRLGGDHVFIAHDGQPLTYPAVHGVFLKLLKLADLSSSGVNHVSTTYATHSQSGRWRRVQQGASESFVTMHAGNERSAIHAVAIEFSGPALRERGRIGRRNLPIQQRPHCFGIFELLLTRKSGVKLMREEMNVRVIDGQIAPWSLRHAESMIADWQPN